MIVVSVGAYMYVCAYNDMPVAQCSDISKVGQNNLIGLQTSPNTLTIDNRMPMEYCLDAPVQEMSLMSR